MIYYYKRNQIDIVKYDTCITKSINTRVYANSWYLDIVADNWDVLVLNDYEAVMPLPWRSKYFIKYIYPPAWTQQLGVFSAKEISKVLISNFIKAIPKKFKKVTIQFNAGNDLSLFKTQKRVNYVLPLNKSYEAIFKGYKKNRKYSIIQSTKNDLFVKNVSFNDLEKIAKEYYNFIEIETVDYYKLELLTKATRNSGNSFLVGVYTKENNLLGGAIFFKDNRRISYLFSVASTQGKEKQANSFLIDYLLKKNANVNYMFDFEGSMISGVANYFKSFGTVKEHYFLYQKPFRLF
ncbi:hypothetical protein [Lutibacter sp.]